MISQISMHANCPWSSYSIKTYMTNIFLNPWRPDNLIYIKYDNCNDVCNFKCLKISVFNYGLNNLIFPPIVSDVR